MQLGQQNDPLSAERLQFFVAGLAGLPQEEVRKAKVLYLRNALAEYRAARDSYRAFGCAQWIFVVIPLFWPMLIFQRRMMKAGMRLMEDRIRNALDVWKDDLQGEQFELGFLSDR